MDGYETPAHSSGKEMFSQPQHYHKNGDTPKQHKQCPMNGCTTHAPLSGKGACLKHYGENWGRIKQYQKLCSEKGCKNIQRRVNIQMM